ncbi:MAG: c-type cytochrome [Gammaproteobacteria bacterium]
MSLLAKLIPSTAIVIGFVISTSASAVDLSHANPGNGKNIFMNGKGDVPACTSCHGEHGEGNDALGTPRLVGQVYQFIVKQLTDFGTCSNPEDHSTCKRQDTTMFVMNTNALGLSEQDRIDIAAFVSTWDADFQPSDLKALEAGGTEIGVSYRGKALVNYGDTDKGIPACRSCHGYNGRGVDPIFPLIGLQKYVYITNQLKNWRSGARHNDPHEAMQKVAQLLDDNDIRDLATFLSSTGSRTQSPGEMGRPRAHRQFEDH